MIEDHLTQSMVEPLYNFEEHTTGQHQSLFGSENMLWTFQLLFWGN